MGGSRRYGIVRRGVSLPMRAKLRGYGGRILGMARRLFGRARLLPSRQCAFAERQLPPGPQFGTGQSFPNGTVFGR